MSNTLVQPVKTKSLQGPLLIPTIADTTFDPGDIYFGHFYAASSPSALTSAKGLSSSAVSITIPLRLASSSFGSLS